MDDLAREKFILLGTLAAGLAHEINTPLAAIRCNEETLEHAFHKLEELLDKDGKPGARDLLGLVRETLETNRLACAKLGEITRGVRNFVRTDDVWKKIGLPQILDDALTLAGHELKGRIHVTKEFGSTPEIDCFPNQLVQVFVNLLVNAAQAIQGPGEIRIRTGQDGEHVHAAISDNGPGMTAEVQSQIFNLGFTTKERGVGTGLGLPICRKIIDNHRGRIEIESRPGMGTTFTIVLPVTQAPERNPNGTS